MGLILQIALGILLASVLTEGFGLLGRALSILFGKGTEDNWYDNS